MSYMYNEFYQYFGEIYINQSTLIEDPTVEKNIF